MIKSNIHEATYTMCPKVASRYFYYIPSDISQLSLTETYHAKIEMLSYIEHLESIAILPNTKRLWKEDKKDIVLLINLALNNLTRIPIDKVNQNYYILVNIFPKDSVEYIDLMNKIDLIWEDHNNGIQL